MDLKDPDNEKYQAYQTRGRVELEGPSENLIEGAAQLEEGWAAAESGLPKLMVILVIGGLVGVVVAMVIFYRMAVNPVGENPKSEPEPVVVVELNFIERSTTGEVHQAVQETVRGFMEAKSNVERCRYVLDGDRLKETMDEFYSRHGSASQPQGFGEMRKPEPGAFEGEAIMLALAVDRSGKKAWMYSLFPRGDGMKIDWETSVSYGEYSWPQFLREKRKEKTQMRVYLQRLPSFKATRKLPTEADAYEVTAFGETQIEVLYVAKESEVNEALQAVVPEKLKHPVNLFLSWNEKGELQADEFIHNLWAAPGRKKNE
ncbi:MAG: hypothetical protein ISR39_08550 [Akkermansiaceae bacterium]|nr:hypothetical protein [Akkermansiaceae bacterium]